MKYLIVVAHPDDEVLGAGASTSCFTKNGDEVEVCILSGKAAARAFRPDDDKLASDMRSSFEISGISGSYIGDFPNIRFNNVDHLLLVQFIEKAIRESQPDVIITHHPGDVNNDHLHTSLACQAAVRLFQRQPSVRPVSEMWYMEVPSSTEWCINASMNKFEPDIFVEIGEEGINKKLEALAAYGGVQRPYPHPRSDEAIKGLAAYRGSQSGCDYAEAFQCALRRITF